MQEYHAHILSLLWRHKHILSLHISLLCSLHILLLTSPLPSRVQTAAADTHREDSTQSVCCLLLHWGVFIQCWWMIWLDLMNGCVVMCILFIVFYCNVGISNLSMFLLSSILSFRLFSFTINPHCWNIECKYK